MIGTINIIGYIGSFPDENGNEIKGVEVADVAAQVRAQAAATSWNVIIDSMGGECQSGYDIYDYLLSLKQPINTIAKNHCDSIATVPFMAGQERIIQEPCGFLPHNPWTSVPAGDATYLMNVSEAMRVEEDKMISFYSKNTGVSKEGIGAIMKKNEPITPEMAMKLGFATKVLPPMKAVAVIKKENETIMNKTILDKLNVLADDFKALFVKIEKKEVVKKAVITTDDKGNQLEILEPDGTELMDGMPDTGDMVNMAGVPAPDGVYTLPEFNLIVTVTGGLIVEAEDTTAGPDPAELATLQAENKALKLALAQKEKLQAVAVAKVNELEATFKALSSQYTPPGQTTVFGKNQGEEKPVNRVLEAKERRKQYKNIK